MSEKAPGFAIRRRAEGFTDEHYERLGGLLLEDPPLQSMYEHQQPQDVLPHILKPFQRPRVTLLNSVEVLGFYQHASRWPMPEEAEEIRWMLRNETLPVLGKPRHVDVNSFRIWKRSQVSYGNGSRHILAAPVSGVAYERKLLLEAMRGYFKLNRVPSFIRYDEDSLYQSTLLEVARARNKKELQILRRIQAIKKRHPEIMPESAKLKGVSLPKRRRVKIT